MGEERSAFAYLIYMITFTCWTDDEIVVYVNHPLSVGLAAVASVEVVVKAEFEVRQLD